MNNFGDLPWTGFEPGTSGSQSDTLPLSQWCSEETDEFSLQYHDWIICNIINTSLDKMHPTYSVSLKSIHSVVEYS